MNFNTFYSKLESELIKYNFVKEDYVFNTSFILGDFVLYKFEHRFDKKDIWYRNTLRGYMNRVKTKIDELKKRLCMKIDSYNSMKSTFDYFCSEDFKPFINNPMFVIAYDDYQDSINAGWIDPMTIEDMIYVMVDYDEALHFNKKIYEEKIDELKLLIKQDKVKKKIQKLETDFV